MDMNNRHMLIITKIFNYDTVKVSKDNDLCWIKCIINNLCFERKITDKDRIYFLDSLGQQG